MATILLSAAGAALGAGVGGGVLGLSGAAIGRAVGATFGRALDQRVLGAGSAVVEAGRIERFRLMGAGEGAGIPRVWGRVRLAGQVIWASRFQENATRLGGGKGAPRPRTVEYSYSVSLAVALCEGVIAGLGRIWADGNEIAPDALDLRVYTGAGDQLPDPKIEAVEGAGLAPAYRGLAYVVIEDLDLAAYGNRVPQFSFEVIRPAQGEAAVAWPGLADVVPGVCLIPGSGEYALATTPVHYALGPGVSRSANVNSVSGKTDFLTSLDQLHRELPKALGVSLVVSWFGNDLRCGQCDLRPKVEQREQDGVGMPWRVAGLTRAQALDLPRQDGRPIYGGSPCDQSVIEAIQALRAAGKAVTFSPFILMEQQPGNGRPDPWAGAADQPSLPWRGRITLNKAPGQPGSTDQTAAAEAEVAAFFGTAQPDDFALQAGGVAYHGPAEWRYRRFVLHYAALCAAAGGVEAFCIGSEMRGLTRIRGAEGRFPAVQALRQLARDVRRILGPSVKISYAADWSEYFGYHVGGDVHFHLDPLWADPDIDFIGIDNYMPLSDWRDGPDHADADWPDGRAAAYLAANVAGGEGFDWFYDGPEAEAAQNRSPIRDAAEGEPWVFRYKDLQGWWSNLHHDRIGGQRALVPTAWVPQSKPIRFTEFGCAAVDKGANQPNCFVDPKSSESALPRQSSGQRDDLMQLAYFQAMATHWRDPARNPRSALYDGPMVDFERSTAWAWDARPYPDFPGHLALWSDGANYDRGHWLNGRTAGQHLAAVVAEICAEAGVRSLDLKQTIGLLRGYALTEPTTARAALQPLTLAFPIDVVERGGALCFQPRTGMRAVALDPARLVRSAELEGSLELTRAADVDTPMHLRLGYVQAGADFAPAVADAVFPGAAAEAVTQSELPLVLTETEARAVAGRWMAEALAARDTARFVLPRSALRLGAGDCVGLLGQTYRIDRIEQAEAQLVEAVRIDPRAYRPVLAPPVARGWVPHVPTLPVYPVFLDLPLMTGAEQEHAPHAAVVAQPWPGPVALWSAPGDDGYGLNRIFDRPAVVGVTETDLPAAAPGRWDRGAPLRLRVTAGALSSASLEAVLAGQNLAAIGDGSADRWELFQFAHADLVGPGVYDLSLRLRGQAGTDGVIPPRWPAGSTVVLIDAAVRQIDLPPAARAVARHYRFGPAGRGYDGASTVLRVEAFAGIGLRPYPVAHLRAKPMASGDLALGWIRRSRIDGDGWHSGEVPLGEEQEAYLLQIRRGGTVLRDMALTAPGWIYPAALRSADLAGGAVELAVAQVSARFGPGPFRRIGLAL